MRAAVTNTDPDAPPVEVREIEAPTPRAGWLTVRLRRAALNRLDAMLLTARQDEVPGAVFGSDGAGIVAAVGSGVGDLRPGDEVVICPSLFWGDRQRVPGDAYEILGSPTRGTHAEMVTVPAEAVRAKPGHLSWNEAAALPLAGLTAWRALVSRGALAAHETVVVGAASSGVGSLAIQIASALGARVVAVTSGPAKAAAALELGAAAVVDRREADLADRLRAVAPAGADLALDPTGALWQPLADALRPGGRLVVVGKMAADVGELRVQSVYWKQLDVLGSSMGSPRDFDALLAHVAEQRWAPVVDSVFALSDIAGAYARLDAPDRVGKVVVDVTR
jgi:zinc-binding alcohol dehydrogenase/oxidoreductase